ncbi:MAG: hypothetical protein ACRDX9_12990 [Acidimicrobiia bacterium]
MQIRSHLLRPFDPTDPWNRAVLALSAIAGMVGAYLTISQGREPLLAVQAAGTALLSWAVCRELDPDRQLPAIVLTVFGGVWAMLGNETAILPFAGLLLVTRLLVESTGRRPLPTDLAVVAVIASVISFTPLGWVMGFGVAVAVYVDDRMAETSNRAALIAAMAAAVGSSVVASLTDAFPRAIPSFRPILIASLGLVAVISVLREPVDPVSFVDSRNKRFIRRDRVQAGRVTAAILVFIGSAVAGEEALAVVPMALVIVTALASTEVERLQRATPGSV